MRKKNDLDDTEKDLFRSAMQGVKRITHTKITPQSVIPRKSKSDKKSKDLNPFQLRDELDPTEVTGEDILEFHRGGLQHKVLRNLRRGQYNVEATLDMHGMRANEAQLELSHFLVSCIKNGIKHVLIIHGKGHGTIKPILKNKLNQWLRQIDSVLAFCSATPQDGRTGAVYVLLKGGALLDE